MKRTNRLTLAAALVMAACGAAPPVMKRVENGGCAQRAPQPQPIASRTISLHCGGSCGIPGPRSDYYLELQDGGPCRATVKHGWNCREDGVTTTYDLPASTFQEVRRALVAADFFSMKDSCPESLFENASSWVSAVCDGERCHCVRVTEPAPAPPGYAELYSLVRQVEKRGTPTGKKTLDTRPCPPRLPAR